MQLMKKYKQEITLSCIAMVIGATILCIAEYMISKNTAICFPIEIWIDGCKILDFFFPLFVTVPFSWMLFYEKKDGFLNYASMRKKRKQYIAGRIVAGMIAALVVTFIIYYIGLLMVVFVLKPKTVVENRVLYRYLWGSFQAENSLVFGMMWCGWKGLIGAVLCAFGYLLALIEDNLFVVSLLPFVYCTIENFVTGTLRLERYSITTAYILNRLSPKNMTVINYFAGIIIFVLIASIIVSIRMKLKRSENDEEFN